MHTSTADVLSPNLSCTAPSFIEWLESGLDRLGLDSILYSRCILSILRQPADLCSEDACDRDIIDQHPDTAICLSNSDDLDISSTSEVTSMDCRKVAILDILKTVDDSQMLLKKFVEELLERYGAVKDEFVRPSVDGIDSGVCPSPDDRFQNYDEAFPPLSDGPNEEVQKLTSCSSSVWRNSGRAVRPLPTHSSLAETGSHMHGFDGDATPRKRQRKDTSGGSSSNDQGSTGTLFGGGGTAFTAATRMAVRPLRSCPDLCTRQVRASGVGTHLPFKKSVTALGHSPQFIVPRCCKVGTGSAAKLECRVDVPFWQCMEWFCPVHRSAELNFVGARLFCAQSDALKQREEVFEPSSFGSSGSSVEMFDAPRFILHIINEDEPAAIGGIRNLDAEQQHSSSTRLSEQGAEIATVLLGSPVMQSRNEGQFEQWMQQQRQQVGDRQANTWGENELTFSLTRGGQYDNICDEEPASFCLPKFEAAFTNVNPAACALSEAKLRPGVLDKEQLSPFMAPHKQHSKLSIPISPQTHFIPIRAEPTRADSVEDAVFPKPGFEEAAVISSEGYHVLTETRSSDWLSLPLKFKATLPEKQCQTDYVHARVLSPTVDGALEADLPPLHLGLQVAALNIESAFCWQETTSGDGFDMEVSCLLAMQAGGAAPVLSTVPDGVLSPGATKKAWHWPIDDAASLFGPSPPDGGTCSVMQFFKEQAGERAGTTACGSGLRSSDDSRAAVAGSQLAVWQRIEEADDADADMLLRYVSNISLISPLENNNTATAAGSGEPTASWTAV